MTNLEAIKNAETKDEIKDILGGFLLICVYNENVPCIDEWLETEALSKSEIRKKAIGEFLKFKKQRKEIKR